MTAAETTSAPEPPHQPGEPDVAAEVRAAAWQRGAALARTAPPLTDHQRAQLRRALHAGG